MKIRKEFRVESAHIVRNCTSHRCSHSIHGHSAVVEVFLEGNKLDNAHMLYDFGLMKGSVKEFIDSMDHCYILCSKDSEEFRNFIKGSCDRWIELPFNPSAEMLSVFIFKYIQHIFDYTDTSNGEGVINVSSIRYHETTTGYAECNQSDVDAFWDKEWEVEFSDGVIKDWSKDLKSILFDHDAITNPIVKQQINLN